MLPSATLIKTLFSKNILHSNYSQKHQKSVRSTVPKAPNQDQLNIVICFGWLLKFKIGLFQLLVTPDKERNIEHVRKAIEEAVQKGAQLVPCLTYSNDSFPVYAEDIDAGGDASPSTAMLSEVSSHPTITIVDGYIPERCGD
ncbi:hypothetical protein POUND7_001345 [Theobroma cacao]